MCSANTIEKTHGRSSKPLWSTVNDRLLTFEQRLWCDRRQMDIATPISFPFLFSMVWKSLSHVMISFSNSGKPLLILYDKSAEPSCITCIWIRCWYVLIWFCRKQNISAHSSKPASHVRSTIKATLCFQMAACLGSFYEIVRPLSAPHHPQPNTKPLPLQARFHSAANSGSSKQSYLWDLQPRPDRRNPVDVESSSSDQTLGHLIPPFLLENFSRTKGWGMDGFGMQYVSFSIKFAHICSLTALERYLPN